MNRTPAAEPSWRNATRPARGIVTASHGGQHQRLLPCAELAPFVAHFWWVTWSVPRPIVVETLPHPCVHVTVERPGGRAIAGGVGTRRFTRRLAGSGRVFGIKFRPATFGPWLGAPVSTITDRRVPFGPLPTLAAASTLEEAIARVEPWLCERVPVLPAQLRELRDLVERIETDRSLVRVEQLAALTSLQLRTLQRRIRRDVGVSAKWVIGRYRLHEAIERLRGGAAVADLAAGLGYFDQAHFTRDFSAMVGQPPRAFARR